MDDNYLGWSAAMAPAIMGARDRPELGEELYDEAPCGYVTAGIRDALTGVEGSPGAGPVHPSTPCATRSSEGSPTTTRVCCA